MRRLLLIAVLVAVPLAGCGNKESEVKAGETESVYLDLNDLRYQVQISRQLNPQDVEDRAYLTGVDPAQAKLKKGESWFAIFVRVENPHERSLPSATQFELSETSGKIYRPVRIARTNPFAYVGGRVSGHGTLPDNGSVAQANESVNGALVLFKVKTATFDNRPLELKIFGPDVPQDVVTVDLDV